MIILYRGEKVARPKLRVLYMTLKGYGRLDNISLASSDHIEMFYSSANWLVSNQDAKGGWPISVKRKIASGRADLAPGWWLQFYTFVHYFGVLH